MRLLLLSHDYSPCGGTAGASTEALARALASRGVTIDVVTAAARTEHSTEILWDGESAEEGLLIVHRLACRRVHTQRSGALDLMRHLLTAWPAIRRMLRGQTYDAIHVVFSPATAPLIPLLKATGIPLVVSAQLYELSGGPRARRSVRLTQALLRPLALEYITIANGVDLARFHPPASRRIGRTGPVRCVTMARELDAEHLRYLIRAAALLPRGAYELDVLGSGKDEHELRALAAGLQLDGIVRFGGSLDDDTIARRYREADLFALSAGDEPAGDIVAQALASGLPIVAASTGAGDALVRPGRHGFLVPPGDPAAFAAGIRRLGENAALRAEIGGRNRLEAETMHSWERTTTRYLALYKNARRSRAARSSLFDTPSSSW